MVQQIPTLEFDWMWIKDKRIILDKVPYTHNWHLIILDDEDDMCGWWLIERIDRNER